MAPGRGRRAPYNRSSNQRPGLLVKVNASIFKAYDIRGVVGTTLDAALAEHLGRAFGTEALRLG